MMRTLRQVEEKRLRKGKKVERGCRTLGLGGSPSQPLFRGEQLFYKRVNEERIVEKAIKIVVLKDAQRNCWQMLAYDISESRLYLCHSLKRDQRKKKIIEDFK